MHAHTWEDPEIHQIWTVNQANCYIYKYTYKYSVDICVCVDIYVCIYIYVCVYIYYICVCVCIYVYIYICIYIVKLLSHVCLLVTPWTVAHQAPPSMEFSRQEYWSGLPFPSPGDLPDPGVKPGSPALQADALPSEPPGISLSIYSIHKVLGTDSSK